MSLQTTNYLQLILPKISLAFGIALIFSGTNVNALPIANNNQTNLSKFPQLLSQNSSEPPEVIIDNDPNGSSSDRYPTRRNPSSSDTRFRCEFVNGEYTVMYYPESQPYDAYPWAVPSQLGGGWTPERRCDEITRRLESYRADGLLELTTDVQNNYDIVCVTTQVDPTDCRIVFTVPPGQDPQVTRDLIFENLLVADDGQQTQGVYTYGDNNSGDNILNQIGNVLGVGGKKPPVSSPKDINLKPFLDPADGGTGERLQTRKSKPARSRVQQSEERQPDLFK